jgi:hypothetical protein
MNTKLYALLTTTVTLLGASFVAPNPAQANEVDDLINALQPFMPTVDRVKIDPSKGTGLTEFDVYSPLTLGFDTNVQVSFLGEAAGYRNKFSYSVDGGSKTTIWADTFTKAVNGTVLPGSFSPSTNNLSSTDLDIGTTVDLGNLTKGSVLDFFVTNQNLVGGVYQTVNTFGFTDLITKAGNTYNRVKGYTLAGFENYLIYAFEDNISSSADRDYNDLVFAVKLEPTAAVPEPSTALALFGLGAWGLSSIKRGKKA